MEDIEEYETQVSMIVDPKPERVRVIKLNTITHLGPVASAVTPAAPSHQNSSMPGPRLPSRMPSLYGTTSASRITLLRIAEREMALARACNAG